MRDWFERIALLGLLRQTVAWIPRDAASHCESAGISRSERHAGLVQAGMQPSIQSVCFFCPQSHISAILFCRDATAFTAAASAAAHRNAKVSGSKNEKMKREKESVPSTAERAATSRSLLDSVVTSSPKKFSRTERKSLRYTHTHTHINTYMKHLMHTGFAPCINHVVLAPTVSRKALKEKQKYPGNFKNKMQWIPNLIILV